jgi:hypothetical protein
MTKHDGVQVDSILIDHAEFGEAVGQVPALPLWVPTALLSIVRCDRAALLIHPGSIPLLLQAHLLRGSRHPRLKPSLGVVQRFGEQAGGDIHTVLALAGQRLNACSTYAVRRVRLFFTTRSTSHPRMCSSDSICPADFV